MAQIASPIVFVVGKTASGKTGLAVEICKRLCGEIVCADSMQIYRGMDIGTAKPTFGERQGIVHHMLDVVTINQDYSVMQYQRDALAIIADIHARNKVAVVCGGTGLYIEALLKEFNFTDAGVDEKLRQELSLFSQIHGNDALYQQLREVDPEAAAKIHPNNTKRIIRAIEVYRLSGVPFSHFSDSGMRPWSPMCMLAINWPRQQLYDRIDRRVDQMVLDGLENEVRALFTQFGATGWSATALQGIGYKEFFPYFRGECALDQVVQTLKQSTRNYAKRQETWFKRYPQTHWIESHQFDSSDWFDNLFADTALKEFVF